MKKLLSICFLSMLLGLLSFGVRAQNDNGCTSGFWIENLQPDTIYGVVNMPPDGKLPLMHTLGTGHYYNSGVFKSNVMPGEQQMYELHFCNTCGLDPKTKVSIDWILLRFNETTGEWEEVNAHLSDYVNFYIYTYYAHLNQDGACQSIGWLGGQVEDGFGYCEDQAINSGDITYDHIQGVFNPCSPWTNYPGAMHVGQGTPMAVQTALNQIVPAAGQFNIYSQNHDYFYLDFFEQTRNIVYLDWKQAGNYKLVMRLRERTGGTPFMNEFWKQNPDGTMSETDYVGGHQSCCGDVIVEDTIGYPTFGEACKEVCEGESYVYGRPPYTFNVTMPDTNVAFGEFRGDDPASDCYYFHTDSVNRFHFFVRETPQVQTQNLAVCKCSYIDLNSLVTLADTANKGVVAVRLEWSLNGISGWTTTVPAAPTTVGTHTYYVRQTNIYNTCGEVLECTGPAAQITITIRELPAPTGGSYDICNEDEALTKTLTVSRANDTYNCSTTSVWKLNGDSVYTGDSYTVTLADLRPLTNIDKVITYHVYAYNAATDCYSADYAVVTLTFHQTPEIQLSYLDTICPHPANVVFNMLVTSTQTEFPYSVHQTSTFDADYDDVLTSPNNQQVTTYHKPYTKIEDFECEGVYYLYYEVTDANGCVVMDTAKFIALDTIPPVVIPDTLTTTVSVCNFEGANRPDTIKTLAGFDGLLDELYDECEEIARFTYKDSTYVLDTCENVLERTYTFYDNCNNASTLTQIFIAHDTTSPYFVTVDGRLLHERLNPKRDTNCTYNSLSKDEFVLALLGKVEDSCMVYDFETLKAHSDFYFEESSTFGHVLAYDSLDIFRTGNGDGTLQIQIEAVVTDNCGNEVRAFVFYFNEPKKLEILHPSITVDPDKICLGESSDLSFDATKIKTDVYFELAEPLTYSWTCANPAVNFIGDTNLDTVKVTPTEAGNYVIYMTVADAYGCTASDSAELFVKAAPNIVIIPVDPAIGNPPYCPNVGHVTIGARDAVTLEVIPGLTYTWTGSQAVDTNSVVDTTQIYVAPELCKHDYDAQVHVVDIEFGCEADAEIIVPVEDKPITYLGHAHRDTAMLVNDCKMVVTDFMKYVADSLYNPCGNWPYDTIWQSPEVGTVITENTPVTVYVVSFCQTDTLEISGMFENLKYRDVLEVDAIAVPTSGCEPATFTHTATPHNAHGPVTYKWTLGITQVSTAQSFSQTQMVAEGMETSTYVYMVQATDSLNCVATDKDTVTVYKTVFDIDTLIEPNTHCERLYNGRITLLNMPEHYKYELFKVYEDGSEEFLLQHGTNNPQLDSEIVYTSIVFDTLVDGNYRIRITTDNGCESDFDFTIDRQTNDPEFNNEVIPHNPLHCTNEDGWIEIVAEPGYTYIVFDADSVEVPYPYLDLPVGGYTVYKLDQTTNCISDTVVNIEQSSASLTFTVTPTANTNCVAPFNGKLKFTKTNVWFVVTDVAADTVVYEGASTTLTGLHPGSYKVFGTDTVTGCFRSYTKNVGNNTNNPDFEITTHPNQYCENEQDIVNGSVTVSPAAAYTYEYFVLNGAMVPPISEIVDEQGNVVTVGGGDEVTYIWGEVADPTHLAANHYKVVATNANGCVTEQEFDIYDSTVVPVVADSSVMNTICDNTIAAYDGKVILTITNYDANNAPYTVKLDTLDEEGTAHTLYTVENAISPVTFNSLKDGDYHYTVTDKYLCVAEGEITVAQETLDSLILKQTPNTFCYWTVAKPGNGTITVMPPYDNLDLYDYKLSYGIVGTNEEGARLDVPFVDLSSTVAWLKDTIYYVTVTNLLTGCPVADTITVLPGRDTLTLTGTPTPNQMCQEPYNGQIELDVTYSPYQFDYSHLIEAIRVSVYPPTANRGYMYSITDDQFSSFQNDNVFTGLKDSTYYFYVMDTITRCIYDGFDSIKVEKQENDIVITDTVTPNHACIAELYDGTITVTATSVMFNPAQFEYSINGGAFSAVNSWDSLAPGVYHIVAREINSGCENSIDVEVNTQNECTPEIEVDSRKYCLNEENATITATAILPEDSECEGDFRYRWHKECYNEYIDGRTVSVPTDQEMCCFYTVTATNVLTGCEAIERVKVCVYATHPIEYTVNHDPIEGNSTVVCENESLWIGIVENGWEEAWWTMNHTTVLPTDNPEYEFFINTADSVAAYASDNEKWTFNDPVTFCVEVIDTNGCYATGKFNLRINPIVRLTNEETVCELPIYFGPNDNLPINPTPGAVVVVNPVLNGYDIDEELMASILDGTVEYPYSVSRVDTIQSVGEGCDTIMTTVLTVLGYPTITGVLEDAYCEGSATVGDLMDSITITNYIEETLVVLLNGMDVTSKMDSALTYDPDYPCMTLTVSCSSSAEMQCYTTKDFTFRLNAVPELSDIDEIDTVCASEDGMIQIPFDYTCRFENASCNPDNNEANDSQDVEESEPCTVQVVLKETPDATDYTVLEYTLFDGNWYEITPVKLSYNNKYIGFKVTNDCGSVFSNFVQLHVDTVPVGEIDTNAICAGLQFADLTSVAITNTADLLDPSKVTITTFVKKVGYDKFTQVDPEETVDYSYNGAEMYAVLDGNNGCGTFTTDTLPVKVSDKPHINMNAQGLWVCADDFDEAFAETFGYYIPSPTPTENPTILPQQFEPFKYNPGDLVPEDLSTIAGFNYVLSNGTPFIHTYWATATINEEGEIVSLDSVSVDDIETLAVDTCIDIYYFAQNACGTDTVGPFPVCIVNAPEITYNTNVICKNSTVSQVLNITNINWHKNPGTSGYAILSTSGDHVMDVDANTTMESLEAYLGYKLAFIATNSCGADTADVVLNIPTWNVVEGTTKPACVGSQFSEFIETAPTITYSNVSIVSQGWYVVNATTGAVVEDEALALTTAVTEPIEVYYKWVTSCGDIITSEPMTLELLYQPEVTINNITICEGSTVDIANANLHTEDPSGVINGDPTWTINGEPYSATATYGIEYNNTDIVVTVPTACGSVTATAKLIVNPNPVVEIEGPEKVCDGTEVTFIADEGFSSYTFTLNDGDPVVQTSNEFTTTLTVGDDAFLGTSVSTVTVSVTNENNCTSSSAGSASVIVSNSVGFIFTNMNHEETNDFEASTGEGLQYIWMVNDECLRNDTLVWVEYEFYRNGVALTNRSPFDNHTPLTASHIENYISTVTVGAGGASSFVWNTKNEMDFEVLNPGGSTSQMHDVSYYFGASGYSAEDFPAVDNYYGNHFPYSNLSFLTTTNYYDDLWMHFLARRPVTQTIAPFLSGGEYTVVFKLYATSYRDNWQNPHIDQADGWSIAENTISPRAIDPNGGILIGGHWYARGIPTLLAIDSIHISVDGPDYEPETLPGAPELAPAVTVDASEIAPDMEVWPNPAPAITTTLKARVHNMDGEATVTLSTLGGHNVYSSKINIDSDSYYFEFDVNNLSVGTYIMTVRNGDAIVTKKVVVTSLSR